MAYDTLPGDDNEPLDDHRRVRPRLNADPLQPQPQAENEEAAPEDVPHQTFNGVLMGEFDLHCERLRKRALERQEAVRLKSAVLDREEREEQSAESMLGRKQPQDEFQVRGALHPMHPMHPMHRG